jgi:hypothetical protein
VPDACNVSWWLAKALQRTQNFVSVTGLVDFATVKAEIDAGRPGAGADRMEWWWRAFLRDLWLHGGAVWR